MSLEVGSLRWSVRGLGFGQMFDSRNWKEARSRAPELLAKDAAPAELGGLYQTCIDRFGMRLPQRAPGSGKEVSIHLGSGLRLMSRVFSLLSSGLKTDEAGS